MNAWEIAWNRYIKALRAMDKAGMDRSKASRGARLRVAKAHRALWRLDPEFVNRVLPFAY